MNDIIEDFKNAMRDYGITPPKQIQADGQLHRFKNEGDKSANSFYTLHLDGIAAGNFGCWKLGINQNWCSKSEQEFTPEERAAYREQCEKAKQQAEAEREKRYQEAARTAQTIYKGMTTDNVEMHPYAQNKGIDGIALVKRGEWKQRGWQDALIIPLFNAKREIVSLQAINSDGEKDFLTGGKKSGAFFPMTNGKFNPIDPALIGEGLATVFIGKVATGYQAFAAMDAGNLLNVARVIREEAPTAKIIILADNDIKPDKPNVGIEKAIEAAKAVNGYVAIPELQTGEKCDFWDVWNAHDLSTVRAMIEKATMPNTTPDTINQQLNQIRDRQNELDKKLGPANSSLNDRTDTQTDTAKPTRQLFTPIGELLKNRKSVSWLIRDYLPLNSTCMVYGESGAGKSFLILDIALSIATGKQWAGQRTKQGAVFYVIGEGQSGIKARCQAWAIHHGVSLENVPFFCTESAVLLPDKNNLETLIEAINLWLKDIGKQPALIVFDTMARCFNGDENLAKDAGGYIQAMDKIKQAFECCVLNVHHTGKDKAKGGRGSSAFKGAWDMEFSLTLQGDIRQLETTKAKETKEPINKFFSLETVATDWLDDDGEIIYSAVMVESVDSVPTNTPAKISLKPNDEKALASLSKALADNGIEPPQPIKDLFGHEPHKAPARVVNIEYWSELAYQSITVNSKGDTSEKNKQNALYMAFNRIYPRLEKLGIIGLHGCYAWLTHPNKS